MRMSKLTLWLAAAGCALGSGGPWVSVCAQETPPVAAAEPSAEEAALEAERAAADARAAQLEAQLGQLRDSSAEAADLMLELTDLYYAHGRAFGLVRVAQKFVSAHPSHERHRPVMLQLIEGLVAVSRNQETTAFARQFLQRYPEDPECPRIELILAEALAQQADLLAAADAYRTVWQRAGATPAGLKAATTAVQMYRALNSRDGFLRGAELADDVFAKLPAGELAQEFGLEALARWRQASEWSKANASAQRLLAAGLPAEPALQAEVHYAMGESYANLNQRANAAASFGAARALRETPELLARQISELHSGQATPAEIEPLVNEFFQRYPDRPERFVQRAALAQALLRAMDTARAVPMLAELLPFEAVSHDTAGAYVRSIGPEPEKNAELERVLLDAIARNPQQAYYLRYYLGFSVYRDRMQEPAKALPVLRQLAYESPSNDSYAAQAIAWVLSNEPTEAEFQTDVQRLIQTRRDYYYVWGNYRQYLGQWIASAKNTPELAARATWAEEQLAAAEQDPVLVDMLAAENPALAVAQEARARLLGDDRLPQLPDVTARALFQAQASSFYYNGTAEERARAADVYGRMLARFPGDFAIAYSYLQAGTDYAPPEVGREAALAMLALAPPANNSDVWRRLMMAADRMQDAALVRQVWVWIEASQQKHGFDPGAASYIGDILFKYDLKAEAIAYWQRTVPLARDSSESRTSAERLLAQLPEAERVPFLRELLTHTCDFHGCYAMWLAGDLLKAKDLAGFAEVLAASRKLQDTRLLRGWGIEESPVQQWLDQSRTDMQATDAQRRQVYTAVRDLEMGRPSAAAAIALLDLDSADLHPMQRILAYQAQTQRVGDDYLGWDRLMAFAQAAMAREDFDVASTLLTGMLANVPSVDATRQQAGRDMIGQSYARMGGTGFSIDENSPIAPLLQAALYLRLGDEKLAYESYVANLALFDQHRTEVPTDLILFVCESHIAAGGDENLDRVEEILRGWLVRFSEMPEIDQQTKAEVQLLLARGYFRGQRYDVARSEYTTVINRYPDTPQAVEAEFGIGESYMAQKVYDQAEAVFERLAASQDRDTVVRAEFLRGVLASRRGDREEARQIFRSVLELVPNIDVANQALFNLAEVYGAEQRYMDQLELLRTVGRLGRTSQRWHSPGDPLSIVVQDSDLGVSRGHARIPVLVRTEPGGDHELVYLLSGGAGKGLFRVDLETQLGSAVADDHVLQLTGNDVIYCDYPEEFKQEFRSVPLSDANIRIASSAELEVSSSQIVDEEEETFSQRIEREQREREVGANRFSILRPKDQIKPGNPVYLRLEDADRDLSDQADLVLVKLTAASGDEVQLALTETGPHTGVFEGTAASGELPAGALASDTSIEHSPLMAIDQDPASVWLSEPDGATPKWLAVDMKDLCVVDHVAVVTPDPLRQAPLRGDLEVSNDGRFWFRVASQPPLPPVEPVAWESGPLTLHRYAGNYTYFSTWNQIVELSKNGQPEAEEEVFDLSWKLLADEEGAANPYAVLWHGQLVQPKAGAARFFVQGGVTALAIDGELLLDVGPGNRACDAWLERGTHTLTVFVALSAATQGAQVTFAREDHNAQQVILAPFRKADFDLSQPGLKPALLRAPSQVVAQDGIWDFRFDPVEVRHVRLNVREYLGEAVAISQVLVGNVEENEQFIPTASDVLALAHNETLEMAAGDTVTVSYTDEFSLAADGRSQLVSKQLLATYYNAQVDSIAYEFLRRPQGGVDQIRKELRRIEPGDRIVVEVVDFDLDVSNQIDTLTIQVAVNDGEPIELTATETLPFSGIFTKEVDTSAVPVEGKLTVKPGDRVYCVYYDAQNTFPGHTVPRETVVFVNDASTAQIRVVETRVIRAPDDSGLPPQIVYLPESGAEVGQVAFEAPLTIEVIDPDAAKDDRSRITVQLTTSSGAKVDVDCVVSMAFSPQGFTGENWALDEGRFIGQVILQLGGKDSPDLVPLSADMPRDLVGGPKVERSGTGEAEALVTRVLNLNGSDVISASYTDERRPDGSPRALAAQGRLISNAVLACLDRDYDKPVERLHVGEKLFLSVTDFDRDTSDERDTLEVEVTTVQGERELVKLEETLAHSGLFTGSVTLKPAEQPLPGNLSADDPAVETYFGDTVRVQYVDPLASTEDGKLQLDLELPVVVGTDGLVAAFSKTFDNEQLAVETQFHMAESYFELFKSHKGLGRNDEQLADLEAGRRILREVMEDYPNPEHLPRIAYLLGQFSQELQQWDEAVESYRMIVRQFPDSPYAADAQYKMAQCYEQQGDFDQALEAYVTLAATYPKSPLIANVMLRISEHFYKTENYEVAAQVGQKFLERFSGHEWAPRMAFRVGQCYYKDKDFIEAGEAFDQFSKTFPDDALSADALFWSGESYRMAGNLSQAFRRYNNCRWNFPSSDAAKYARGRLALPEMLQQFESEANSVDEN